MYSSSLEFQAGRGKGSGYWEYHKIDDLGFTVYRPHIFRRHKQTFNKRLSTSDDNLERSKKSKYDDTGDIEEDSLSNPDIAILQELKPSRSTIKLRRKNFKPTNLGGDDYGPTSIHCNCDINDLSKCLEWHGYCKQPDELE